MNFVYICRDGDNEELRYSIRSIYKNIESPNIWVVGGRPNWYSGNYVKVDQRYAKHVNARNNLKKIVSSKLIPDDFILMNDDFFIMNPVKDIPYMHGGSLLNKLSMFKKYKTESSYTKMLSDTYDALFDMGIKDPFDYAVHVPIKVNKKLLSKIIYPSLSVRTMYGNVYNVGGIQINDVKLSNKDWFNNKYTDISGTFISSNDKTFPILLENIFKFQFKDKSPLEAD